MISTDYLSPSINDGRLFVSPVLGCSGACSYCYLSIKDYKKPKKNTCSVLDCLSIANQSGEFVLGRNGTIISVGAWGDVFPKNDMDLTKHSIQTIKALLAWGNPVQIMSKYSLQRKYIEEIVKEIRYPGQLLYSTTITSLTNWRKLEPGTSSPIDRLITCFHFHEYGVPTNVLLKPFISTLAGTEIDQIADNLSKYHIDYCIIGILYWNDLISKNIHNNTFLLSKIDTDGISSSNHLDCNGCISLNATVIDDLLYYVHYLRKKGISAFLKSSCVSANILHIVNPSRYSQFRNPYCIKCGNCSDKKDGRSFDEH